MKRLKCFLKIYQGKLPVNPSAFGILIDIVVKILIRTRSKISSRVILPVTFSVGTQGIISYTQYPIIRNGLIRNDAEISVNFKKPAFKGSNLRNA